MFDIGFWELTLIGLVALIVIGPDKLPGLARTAGLWIGKMRYFLNNVKADINRELKTDELRNALQNNADIDELKQILNSTRDTLNTQIEPDYLLKSHDDGQAATTTVTDAPANDIDPAQSPPVTTIPAAQSEHTAPATATGQNTPATQPEHTAPAAATGQNTPATQPEHTAPATATGRNTPPPIASATTTDDTVIHDKTRHP